MHSTTGSDSENAELVRRAWNLDELADSYAEFNLAHEHTNPAGPEESFRAVIQLVHGWHRFPFSDPELPTELLPDPWAGTTATSTFHRRHATWSAVARRWFRDLESAEQAGS